AVADVGDPLGDLCDRVLFAQIAGDVSLLEVDADDGISLALEEGCGRLPDSRCCSGDDDGPCPDASLTDPPFALSLGRLAPTAQSTDGADSDHLLRIRGEIEQSPCRAVRMPRSQEFIHAALQRRRLTLAG